MKKKLLMIAIAWVISLSTAATAAISITTATGSGADGGIANDSNIGPAAVQGATCQVRFYAATRAKAALLRFDIRSVGGDLSGGTLSILETAGNRGRTFNIYALTDDSLDNWDEAILCYNNAPAMVHEGETGYVLGDLVMVPDKWTLVGTMPAVDNRTLNNGNPLVTSGGVDPNMIRQDKNGLLTLLIYPSATDSTAEYTLAMKEFGIGEPMLTFPNARCALNPVPAARASVLPSQSTLSWTNTEPNHPTGTITCNVYFGTNEPNFAAANYGMTQIVSGTTATSVAIPAGMLPLAEDTYYWIVDSYDSSTIPNFLGTGANWMFNATYLPVIASQPQPQTVRLGETAAFSITVDSYTTPQYTWYRSADNANNTPADDVQFENDSATLSFTAAGADEGYYFCKVVNSTGEANAVYSNVALLLVQRQVAHWTLNAADFVGGLYQDVSGEGHHADPNTDTPTFVAGVAEGSDAVSMDPLSFASAGTWNPAYLTGQLTISAWINWEGENGSYQDVLSKMDTYLEADMMWQFGVSQGGNVSMLAEHGNNDNAILNGQPPVGTWAFIAVTFDGTNAVVYRVLDGNLTFTTVSGAYSFGTDLQAAIVLGGRSNTIFNGAIDDVQVFNYAKNPVEIAELYNQMLARDFCVLAFANGMDMDANDNCRVDMADLAALATAWTNCGLYPETACP